MSGEASNIVLWGNTQVGKTTALASYVCHQPPGWLDRDADETAETIKILNPTWTSLRRNQLPPGTTNPDVYSLRHEKGRLLNFRDMRGGLSQNLQSEDAQALRTADAVMLFVAWPRQGNMRDILAAENALSYMKPNCHRVLVLTKIECALLYEEALRLHYLKVADFAKERQENKAFTALLERLPPDKIFPISVYGYTDDGHPAHYRDEFGRLVPRHIQPLGVEKPFQELMAGLL